MNVVNKLILGNVELIEVGDEKGKGDWYPAYQGVQQLNPDFVFKIGVGAIVSVFDYFVNQVPESEQSQFEEDLKKKIFERIEIRHEFMETRYESPQ